LLSIETESWGLCLYREGRFRSGVVFFVVVAAAAVSFSLAVGVGVDAMNELIVGSDAVSLQQGINGSWGLGSNGVRVRICDCVHIHFLLAHPLLRVFLPAMGLDAVSGSLVAFAPASKGVFCVSKLCINCISVSFVEYTMLLVLDDDDVQGLDWRGSEVVSGSSVALTPASKVI